MAESKIATETVDAADTIDVSVPALPFNPTEAYSQFSQQEVVHMVDYMAKAMQRDTHLHMLSQLKPEVRKRLRALRKLQLETNAVEIEFHEKEFDLEKEFQAKHQEILKRRFEIVTGAYEPKDEECDYPDPDLLQRIDENISMFTHLNIRAKDDNEETNSSIIGVPSFWLHILYSNPMLDFVIHDGDEDILKHLVDIRTLYQSKPHYAFILEFEFSPNPFFENSILTKEYLLKMKFDDVLFYEGPEIYKTIGSDIKWKTEKRTNEMPSFLDFFSPPMLPEDVTDPCYEEIKTMLESDFEIGNYIKDHIIPKATLYYTGEFHDGFKDSLYSDSGECEEDADEETNEKTESQ